MYQIILSQSTASSDTTQFPTLANTILLFQSKNVLVQKYISNTNVPQGENNIILGIEYNISNIFYTSIYNMTLNITITKGENQVDPYIMT